MDQQASAEEFGVFKSLVYSDLRERRSPKSPAPPACTGLPARELPAPLRSPPFNRPLRPALLAANRLLWPALLAANSPPS